MALDGRSLVEVAESDLIQLVADQVAEGRSIEYKSELTVGSDAERKEFLADVSSFANAAGGHLLYGIPEAAGIPTELSGIDIADTDETIRRLENIIRDGIEPRILGSAVAAIRLGNGKYVLAIRIPRSLVGPHMVTFRGQSKFFSRNSAGKYQLDAFELRSAFLLSSSVSDRIKEFRIDRVAKLIAGEAPHNIPVGAPYVVLHIVPLQAFATGQLFEVSELRAAGSELTPLYSSRRDSRHNFDGIVVHSELSYLQQFRDGILETVSSTLIDFDTHRIPSYTFEDEVIKSLQLYIDYIVKLGIQPPVFVLLSLVNVRGYSMATRVHRFPRDEHPIDRDTILVPELAVLELDSTNADKIIRPAFDMVWNAAGWPGSTNYNDAGEWVAPR